jgi:hypothetical protein
LATEVGWRSEQQPLWGQFKAGYARSGSGVEGQRLPRPDFGAAGPWLFSTPRNKTLVGGMAQEVGGLPVTLTKH